MSRRICLVLVAFSLMASLGTAQYHDAKYITGYNTIKLFDGTGTTSTISQLYDNLGYCYGMAMAPDNKSLWFCDSGTGTSGLHKLDLKTLAITTFVTNTMTLYYPRDVVVNQDGDLVITSYGKNGSTYEYNLLKYSGGSLTKICPTQLNTSNWYGGMEIGIDSGKYTIQARQSPYYLIEIDEAGTITTLGSGGAPRYSITQDIKTGDWYQGSFTSLYKLAKGTTAFASVALTPTTSKYYYALAMDRASAAKSRIVSTYGGSTSGTSPAYVFYTDITTSPAVVTSISALGYLRSYEMEFHRGNNLCTAKTGAGKWDINLSFPSEASMGYIVAMSFTGVRPAMHTLGDGRTINLAFDMLTFLSVNNLLGFYFNPGPGALDAAGEATASIDVSSLGSLGGIRVWIEAAVFQGGVFGTIADPVGITMP